MTAYYKLYVARRQPWSADLDSALSQIGQSVYTPMDGPSDFTITGTLRAHVSQSRRCETYRALGARSSETLPDMIRTPELPQEPRRPPGGASLLLAVVILGGVAAVPCARADDRADFPAHWWTPVPREGAPQWEILPQEAGPGEVILSKRHELGLLSNFAPTPFTFRGRRYASLEGFWQMMLYPESENDPRAKYPGLEWQYSREQVAGMTSFEAKKAGDLAEANMRKMNIDWVSFEGRHFVYRSPKPGEHYRLIVAATREKVKQNAEVRRVLLATGDLVLRPDHHQEPDAPPEWRYFEILTQIRADLRKGR